uniref:Ig-like domain-containing protein n=1 Tax=Paramormyrops kingsleyae TaxID=1676925 RepID=A0A3B3T4R2_9TELE
MDPLMLLFLLIAGLTDADNVSTVNWVSAWRGESVTIPCFYSDRYKTHVKYWCRGHYRDSCPPIVHSDSPQEGKVSIRDDPDQQVFTVTINNLTAGDSGYYSCGVKISEGSDVGDRVSLSVTDVHSDSPQEGKVSIRDDPDQQVFTVTINSLTDGDSDIYSCGVKISGGSDVGDWVSLSITDGKMSVLQTVANEMHSM